MKLGDAINTSVFLMTLSISYGCILYWSIRRGKEKEPVKNSESHLFLVYMVDFHFLGSVCH